MALNEMKSLDKFPQKTSKSLFFEKWANTEVINGQLCIVVWALVLALVGVLGVSGYLFIAPKPIYYIPGAKDAGISWPGQIKESSVFGFASSWVLNWANFSPETINEVYARSIKYLGPEILSRTKANFEKDVKEILRKRISSQFSLLGEPEIVNDDEGFVVDLKGEKTIYMGKEQLSKEYVFYTLVLKRVPPTEINPYGLLIQDIKQEVSETMEKLK